MFAKNRPRKEGLPTMENTIPDWLKTGVPELEQAKNQLTASRTELFKSLDLYYTHVKYVITLMFSLMTALFAILGLTEKMGNHIVTLEMIKILVGTTLITMFPLAVCAIGII